MATGSLDGPDPYSSLRERLIRAAGPAGEPPDDRRLADLAAQGIADIEEFLRKHAVFELYYAARARRPARVRDSTA